MRSINASRRRRGPDLHAIIAGSPDRPDGAVIPAWPIPSNRSTSAVHASRTIRSLWIPAGSVDTAGTQPPVDGVGFWTELDETTGATFVRTGAGDRGALVYSGGQAYGLMVRARLRARVGDGRGYDGKGNHAGITDRCCGSCRAGPDRLS